MFCIDCFALITGGLRCPACENPHSKRAAEYLDKMQAAVCATGDACGICPMHCPKSKENPK